MKVKLEQFLGHPEQIPVSFLIWRYLIVNYQDYQSGRFTTAVSKQLLTYTYTDRLIGLPVADIVTQIGAECLGRTCLPGRVGPIATTDIATRMPRRRHCHVCGPMPAPVSCYQSASGERVRLCKTLLFTPTALHNCASLEWPARNDPSVI